MAGGFSLFGANKTSGAGGSVWTALVPGVWSFGQGRGVLVLGTRDGMHYWKLRVSLEFKFLGKSLKTVGNLIPYRIL